MRLGRSFSLVRTLRSHRRGRRFKSGPAHHSVFLLVNVEFRTFLRGSGGFLRASVACLRVLGLLFIGVVEEVSGSHLQGFSARDGGCIQGFLACLGRASVAGHKGFLWARFFSVFRCFAFV